MKGHKLSNSKTLAISTYLIGIFLIIEAVGGIMANSLALLADAGHMLSDFLAVLLSLIASRYVYKPADNKRSFGYGRMQIIASFINGITLVGISIIIAITAVIRMINPPTVEPNIMLGVSSIGIIVNVITLYILHLSKNKNLNMKGAILHIIGDLLGFISALVGAIIIKFTHLYIVDPILSILISALILNSSIRLIRESLHILMEGAPKDIQPNDIKNTLLQIDGVVDVEHIHLWLLHDQYTMLTLNLILNDSVNPFDIIKLADQKLKAQHNIQHSTIEVIKYNSNEYTSRSYDHHHIIGD